MNKKNEYCLTINYIQDADVVFPFRYSSIKDASIAISERGIRISVRTTSLITAEAIMRNQNKLFIDAIKKAVIIYALRYSKVIIIDRVDFCCNGVRQELSGKDFPILFISDKYLARPFPKAW